ncbi:hypothetical protein D3C80_1449800 [compost metagenome]
MPWRAALHSAGLPLAVADRVVPDPPRAQGVARPAARRVDQCSDQAFQAGSEYSSVWPLLCLAYPMDHRVCALIPSTQVRIRLNFARCLGFGTLSRVHKAGHDWPLARPRGVGGMLDDDRETDGTELQPATAAVTGAVAATHCDRGHHARDRWRPVCGQGHRRAGGDRDEQGVCGRP